VSLVSDILKAEQIKIMTSTRPQENRSTSRMTNYNPTGTQTIYLPELAR
jgi:hypothetical protein